MVDEVGLDAVALAEDDESAVGDVLDFVLGDLAKISKIKLASPTPQNNHIYKLEKKHFKEISTQPAVWLVASSHGESICFSEMWQKPTSGTGFLKRTLSKRRCQAKFREMCHKRKAR